MKKRLALIYPNQRWQKDDANTVWDLNPVSLCLLAAMVKDIVDIKIIDAQLYDMSEEQYKREISEFSPHFIGVSVMTSEYQDTLDIAISLAKETDNNIVSIAGGIHITTKYEYAFRNEQIDYGIRGEGEYALKELLLYLLGKQDFPKEGIIYRDNDKVVAQKRVLIPDLTKLPWADYSYVNLNDYITKGARIGPNRAPGYPAFRLLTTRGCSFGCTFCQVELISGRATRARDPKDVVDELFFLKDKYGIKSLIFEDDNLLMADGGRYAKKLFREMIDRELNLEWVGIAFALFLLTEEILELMSKSGCTGINVAIESGNKRVLKELVKKPIKDITKVPQIIADIQRHGMYCIGNFIVGFPGETWEEIRETMAFAETCGADYVKFFVAVPLYGTELYDIAMESGSIIHSEEFPITDWRYSQIKSDEWTSKDISILRAYEWDRINFAPHKIQKQSELWGVSVEELNKIRKRTRDTLEF